MNDLNTLEGAALREKLDTLAQKHARAVAELDETEEENMKLINALCEIKKTVNTSAGQNVTFKQIGDQVIDIVNKHIK